MARTRTKDKPAVKTKDADPEAEDKHIGERHERRAYVYAKKLIAHIKRSGGQFLRDEAGALHVIVSGRRVPLDYDRKNSGMAELMLAACNVSTLSGAAQAAIQRLRATANKEAGGIHLRHFSALSEDRERLYIPVHGGKLLCITAQRVRCVANGEDEDSFWVEHPYGEPMKYTPGGPRAGLALFERLLAETQACRVPALRWLVGMDEGFFPYVRDACRARFLLVHIGGTQQGKTSGVQRFTLLHGLGEVKGDYTVAAFADMGDIGLLAMDNKEQANFTQRLIDFCLFLSTGAERGRSSAEGKVRVNKSRPVGVLTTIEGVWKAELQARCIEVQYKVAGEKIGRDLIEDEILRRRHEILSAMVPVLQCWLKRSQEHHSWPNPIPDFGGHFAALCGLLDAYGEIAGKPPEWSTALIASWTRELHAREAPEDELEFPLLRILEDVARGVPEGNSIDTIEDSTFQGKRGVLYVTETAEVLELLRKRASRDIALPRNAAGLSRRLRSAKFRTLRFLDEESAEQFPILKRTAHKRPIGFFVEDDAVTPNDAG